MSGERGKRFEIVVEGVLRQALVSRRLGLLSECATVYRRKGYFSRDRNDLIIIDVSIEVVLPGATTWSMLWAWECKDYERPIEVGKVEEFCSKLQQIGGANIKGGFASAGPLQRAALQYAIAKGIMVARISPGFIDLCSYCAAENFPRSPKPPPPTVEDLITDPKMTRFKWSDARFFSYVSCCAVSSRGETFTDMHFLSFVEHEIEAGINSLSRDRFDLIIDEEEAIARIAKWFGERSVSLNDKPIRCSYVEKVLGLPENSGRKLIPLVVAKFNRFVEHQSGDFLVLGRRKIRN